MAYFAGNYDVLVIGAGHAGIEAALAAARLGCRTVIFTMNLDWIGNMACNPSIGGTSKGHLVREIDALGGEMAHAADATTLQSRMLNLGKGPAVHSLRAQIDRKEYTAYMKNVLELQEGLHLRQAEIVDLFPEPEGGWRIHTRLGAAYTSKTVILATGTFLAGKIFVGDAAYESGPDGAFPACALAEALKRLGLPLRRFKTGTPARVNRRSIDFAGLELQPGDAQTEAFSYDTAIPPENKLPCHMTWTNDATKQVILDNLHRSPLYGGQIEGVGPRYCPSIEDKMVRFAEKERHPVFIEPCGLGTQEMYLQGLSSSLPEDVQLAFLHTIPGFAGIEMMRTAYAIEYDCVDPLALHPTLECLDYPNLYGAGQFNGSSGYEEAAAQGLMAGINAAHKILGREPFVLDRATSYIGTLIDDLVTKGCSDPYRMMTSRSEYRLILRQDNADERLMERGYAIGLVSEAKWAQYVIKRQQKQRELVRIQKTILPPSEALNTLLVSCETSPVRSGISLLELLRRPQLDYGKLTPLDPDRPDLPESLLRQVEVEVKYEGYIQRQQAQIAEMRRLEEKKLPADAAYQSVHGLRLEAREKLQKVRPENVGQASRISGVTPADLSVLLIWLRKGEQESL